MKSISKQGVLPFNIGGFCVTAANINGELKYNLNIFNQRSSTMYDLIDTNFNVYTFISITSIGSNNVPLDPTQTPQVLAPLLPRNSFIITVDSSSFIESFQTNKLKLSTGSFKYHPWDLYFCNIPDTDSTFDASKSSFVIVDNHAVADSFQQNVVKLNLRDRD